MCIFDAPIGPDAATDPVIEAHDHRRTPAHERRTSGDRFGRPAARAASLRSSLARQIVCALLALLPACGGGSPTQPSPAPAPAPPPAPVRATLSGTVVDDGQKGVGGARVEIVQGTNQGAVTTADGEGRYQLANLELGSFTLRAEAAGFDVASQTVTLAGNQTLNLTLRRAGTPGPAFSGFVVDALTDAALGGVRVRIDGLGETTSGADGGFTIAATDPQTIRLVNLSSGSTVDRATRLRVPGDSPRVTLIPSSVDMTAFNEMFRGSNGELHRWVIAPRLVIQRRTLQYTSLGASSYTALAPVLSDEEVATVREDFEWALAQLTAGNFTTFADVRVETADEGSSVSVFRTDSIHVARYQGLTSGTGYWGYARWNWNGLGEVHAGIVMLDQGFETSGSGFRRSLRAHELGHALGYTHVTVRDSVMQSHARTEPNAADRNAARIAFLRAPRNRAPDIDPDPFVGNLRALASQWFWSGDR